MSNPDISKEPYNVLSRRAALYYRYSSDGQNEATISAQRRICKTFADTDGYTPVKEYVDEAETGTTSDNRTDFLRMLSDAKKGLFDYIIVWQFSRFARNKEESVLYKAMLRKVGVRVISATEKTDDTPSGKLLEGMLEVLNQYFSDNLSVEVKKGKKENLLTGKHAGGETPYGIYKEEDTTVFRINEAQAKTIRLIFDLYIQGYGYRRIAAILEEKGHKPPKGDKWNGGSIGKILKNEAYIGIYNYTLGAGTSSEENFKLDNVYPAIIDDNTWALAQKARVAKKPKRSQRNRLYLLTGKAVCGSCGKNYVGHSSNGKKYKYYYYRCNGRSMHARNETSCKAKDIQAEKLEKWALDNIAHYILSDNAIKTILDSVTQKVKSRSNTSAREIKKLEKEAEKLDARIENMLDLYDDGKLSKARLQKRTEGLEKQLDNVRLELEQLRKLNSTNVDIAALREFLFQYRASLENASPEMKKTFIDAFVDKVIITNEKIMLSLKVDDALCNFDNFKDMYNGVVIPYNIYEKNVDVDFKTVAKAKI